MALLSEDLYGGVSVDLGLQSAAIKGHNATNSIVQQYYHTSSEYQNDLSLNQVPALERIQHNLDNTDECQTQPTKVLALPNILYTYDPSFKIYFRKGTVASNILHFIRIIMNRVWC